MILGEHFPSDVSVGALVMAMCLGTTASAYAVDPPTSAKPVTADTHILGDGTYRVSGNVVIDPDDSTGNGIRIEERAMVLLFID